MTPTPGSTRPSSRRAVRVSFPSLLAAEAEALAWPLIPSPPTPPSSSSVLSESPDVLSDIAAEAAAMEAVVGPETAGADAGAAAATAAAMAAVAATLGMLRMWDPVRLLFRQV